MSGTSAFLQQLGIENELDTYHWTSLNPKEYNTMLGALQYDKVQEMLIELRVIRRFIDHQLEVKPNATKWSYVDYLVFREKHLSMDQRHFPEAKEVLDKSSDSIRNIRIINPSNRQKRTLGNVTESPSKRHSQTDEPMPVTNTVITPVPPPYKINSPHLEPGTDPTNHI